MNNRQQRRHPQRYAVQPGFTTVRNQRIDGAMQAMFAMLVAREPHRNPADLQQEAVRAVMRTLPHPPMVRSTRRKPSKNDSPIYRKAVAGERRFMELPL